MASFDRIQSPPEGVTPNYDNPPSLLAETLALNTVLLVLVTIALLLRVYARHFMVGKLWWDDWACIVSWALAIVLYSFVILGHTQGLGKHSWDLRGPIFGQTFKTFYAITLLYLITGGVTRLSYLIFYKRLFTTNARSKIPIWFGIVLVSIITVVTFLLAMLRCIPIAGQWNNSIEDAKCIAPPNLAKTTAACAVVADIYILVLPFPFLWKLQMNLAKKLRLLAVFAVGLISCAASITRLILTFKVFFSQDVTMDMSRSLVWILVEVYVGIIASCMLAFPALFKHRWARKLGIGQSTSYASHRATTDFQMTGTTRYSTRHQQASVGSDGDWINEPKYSTGTARDSTRRLQSIESADADWINDPKRSEDV
jgi:hypothetical protein